MIFFKKVYTVLFSVIFLWKFNGIWGLKNHMLKKTPSKLLISIYDNYFSRYGSWIGYNSILEETPNFPHGFYGIFISGGAKIGKNVVIFQQVTIGSNTLRDNENFGSPQIGNNVYIGAGAKIIGNITIGDNCRIGANAVVYKDMHPNSVAVLSPTRIIQKSKLDNRHYSKKGDKWYYLNNGIWNEDSSFNDN